MPARPASAPWVQVYIGCYYIIQKGPKLASKVDDVTNAWISACFGEAPACPACLLRGGPRSVYCSEACPRAPRACYARVFCGPCSAASVVACPTPNATPCRPPGNTPDPHPAPPLHRPSTLLQPLVAP